MSSGNSTLLQLRLSFMGSQINYYEWRSKITWRVVMLLTTVFSFLFVLPSAVHFTRDAIATMSDSQQNTSQLQPYQAWQSCLEMYLASAVIQFALICMVLPSAVIIQEMNRFDAQQIRQLMTKSQCICTKLFVCRNKMYKQRLLSWSEEMLPKEMNAMVMSFVKDEAYVQTHSCYYTLAVNALSVSLLFVQIVSLSGICLVTLKMIKNMILQYCSEFMFHLIIAGLYNVVWIVSIIR
eukprot:181143_1